MGWLSDVERRLRSNLSNRQKKGTTEKSKPWNFAKEHGSAKNARRMPIVFVLV
jgi:hypothetical protein